MKKSTYEEERDEKDTEERGTGHAGHLQQREERGEAHGYQQAQGEPCARIPAMFRDIPSVTNLRRASRSGRSEGKRWTYERGRARSTRLLPIAFCQTVPATMLRTKLPKDTSVAMLDHRRIRRRSSGWSGSPAQLSMFESASSALVSASALLTLLPSSLPCPRAT